MKNLQEIQKENRKMILEAISMENVLLTLDRVLLALKFKHFGFDWCELEPDNIWIYTNGLYEDWITWNLTKPTLEEQSEETQRAIHKLIGGENDR